MGEDFILQKHSSAVWCLTGASWGDGGATVGKEAVFFFFNNFVVYLTKAHAHSVSLLYSTSPHAPATAPHTTDYESAPGTPRAAPLSLNTGQWAQEWKGRSTGVHA